MIYKEEQRDLFSVGDDYYFAQCISADFGMGKGIAVEFNRRFDTKHKMVEHYGSWVDRWDSFTTEQGICILEGRVYNLITKRNYWDKPIMTTMKFALVSMRNMIEKNPNAKKIAMPKIGCGLDKLNWPDVKEAIIDIFAGLDIEILVCYL